MKLQGMIDDLK